MTITAVRPVFRGMGYFCCFFASMVARLFSAAAFRFSGVYEAFSLSMLDFCAAVFFAVFAFPALDRWARNASSMICVMSLPQWGHLNFSIGSPFDT